MPIQRYIGPLPENTFVVNARDSIPQGNMRVTTASTRGNLRGRGRARSTATIVPARRKRNSEASTSAAQAEPETSFRGRTRGRGYRTGPGSAHHLLFGPNAQPQQQQGERNILDLNEEIPLSQNAPCDDELM